MNPFRKIDIMGIINVTDNSFYQASRFLGRDGIPMVERIADKVRSMLSDGASIIDIGACSSRPGSEFPDMEEEWRRLKPVLEALVRMRETDVRFSIDTFRSEIVRRAYKILGPFTVNDISAGQADENMLSTAGSLGLEYVAMHMKGTPATMQALTEYGTSATEGLSPVSYAVIEYFKEFDRKAGKYGVKNWIMDPGFGFAKDIEQNYALMRDLDKIRIAGYRMLIGVSRKSMVHKMFGISIEDSLAATQVLHLHALRKGADILRVHDVAEAARTVALYRKLET